MKHLRWLVLLSLGAVVGRTSAQSHAHSTRTLFPRFAITQGSRLEPDGIPTSGARLCVLSKVRVCYTMPSHRSENVTFEFGLEPLSERLTLMEGGSWIFFSAMFSAGGSGTLERLAVLRYEDEAGGRIVNLLPYVSATNVSERAMWTLPEVSSYPVLVHADFVWGEGETHFDEHFFNVEAWTFNSVIDRYEKAFSYQTSKKYSGGDSDRIRVLRPEREEILRQFAKTYQRKRQ